MSTSSVRCHVPSILALFAAVCVTPLCARAQELAEGPVSLADELAPLVMPWVGAGFFPGVVVGVARGAEVWIQGYGETVVGNGVAPDARTLYEIGSLTKVYTGLLLADAHLRGVARLEDTLAAHLPAGTTVPSVDGAPIRLVHLATHTSGLARLPSNLRTGGVDPYATYDAGALYAGLAAARPTRAPGGHYAYSNFGTGALGHALARATGVESYEQLCLARLCVVHGFDDTRVVPSPEQSTRLAPPHDEALRPSASWGFDALAAAGGLRATTDDLVRFGQLFVAGATHTHAAAAALTLDVHSTPEGGPPMGLGWHHARGLDAFTRVVAHEGQTGGYHSVLLVAPEERIVVTVLANAPCESLGQLGVALLRRAHGAMVEPRAIAPLVANDDTLQQRALVELPGTYTVGVLDSVEIEATEGALFARRARRPRVRLNPVSGDRYEYRVVEGALEVLRDADGGVRGVALIDGDRREEARRK
jgi:D-alanyl-D-alanine-carboxypeptidase/D-alanyl-D-alanine-endopeptidase